MPAVPRSTPPADLDRAGAAAWRRFRGLLLERGVFDHSSPELLDELVRSLQDCRAARERIAARVDEFGDVPEARWVKGSRGQWVESPDAQLIRHALADALRIGDALLLTPAAARRAGVVSDREGLFDPFADIVGSGVTP